MKNRDSLSTRKVSLGQNQTIARPVMTRSVYENETEFFASICFRATSCSAKCLSLGRAQGERRITVASVVGLDETEKF